MTTRMQRKKRKFTDKKPEDPETTTSADVPTTTVATTTTPLSPSAAKLLAGMISLAYKRVGIAQPENKSTEYYTRQLVNRLLVKDFAKEAEAKLAWQKLNRMHKMHRDTLQRADTALEEMEHDNAAGREFINYLQIQLSEQKRLLTKTTATSHTHARNAAAMLGQVNQLAQKDHMHKHISVTDDNQMRKLRHRVADYESKLQASQKEVFRSRQEAYALRKNLAIEVAKRVSRDALLRQQEVNHNIHPDRTRLVFQPTHTFV